MRQISAVLRSRSVSLGGHPQFTNGARRNAHTGLHIEHHSNSKRDMLSAAANLEQSQHVASELTNSPSTTVNQLQMSCGADRLLEDETSRENQQEHPVPERTPILFVCSSDCCHLSDYFHALLHALSHALLHALLHAECGEAAAVAGVLAARSSQSQPCLHITQNRYTRLSELHRKRSHRLSTVMDVCNRARLVSKRPGSNKWQQSSAQDAD